VLLLPFSVALSGPSWTKALPLTFLKLPLQSSVSSVDKGVAVAAERLDQDPGNATPAHSRPHRNAPPGAAAHHLIALAAPGVSALPVQPCCQPKTCQNERRGV